MYAPGDTGGSVYAFDLGDDTTLSECDRRGESGMDTACKDCPLICLLLSTSRSCDDGMTAASKMGLPPGAGEKTDGTARSSLFNWLHANRSSGANARESRC